MRRTKVLIIQGGINYLKEKLVSACFVLLFYIKFLYHIPCDLLVATRLKEFQPGSPFHWSPAPLMSKSKLTIIL